MLRIKQELQAQKDKAAEDWENFTKLDRMVSNLKITLTASIYFNAIRQDNYLDGGEEYLTFSMCTVNEGGGMDPKSGIFTAPVPGAYVISLHVCTHDMKKALISMRRNGVEIASLFDQNHVDNHKNSMASTTLIVELNQGDKVQVQKCSTCS